MVDFKFIAPTPSVQKRSLTKFPMLHDWSKVTGMSSSKFNPLTKPKLMNKTSTTKGCRAKMLSSVSKQQGVEYKSEGLHVVKVVKQWHFPVIP